MQAQREANNAVQLGAQTFRSPCIISLKGYLRNTLKILPIYPPTTQIDRGFTVPRDQCFWHQEAARCWDSHNWRWEQSLLYHHKHYGRSHFDQLHFSLQLYYKLRAEIWSRSRASQTSKWIRSCNLFKVIESWLFRKVLLIDFLSYSINNRLEKLRRS